MPSYRIKIIVTDAGGTYTADNLKEAEAIAERECTNIYNRLGGRCGVEVESVEEVSSM